MHICLTKAQRLPCTQVAQLCCGARIWTQICGTTIPFPPSLVWPKTSHSSSTRELARDAESRAQPQPDYTGIFILSRSPDEPKHRRLRGTDLYNMPSKQGTFFFFLFLPFRDCKDNSVAYHTQIYFYFSTKHACLIFVGIS